MCVSCQEIYCVDHLTFAGVEMKIFGNRYVVVGTPREGGMSEVYPGIDTKQAGKKVAVKLFTRGKFEDDILHEAYDREIRALKGLKHPNIVELLDFGKDDASGSEFLVLGVCRG